MSERLEYVAVKLHASSLAKEAAVTERLNAVAEHGWRFAGDLTGTKGETTFVVFERYADE